ncbi:MAG: hypothetical protein WAL63_02920 [Solirubrobacteraceae bacterium]
MNGALERLDPLQHADAGPIARRPLSYDQIEAKLATPPPCRRDHMPRVTSNMTRTGDIVPTARVTPATRRRTIERRVTPLEARERSDEGD